MLSISNVDGLTATRNEALRGIRRSRFSLHLNTARRRRWLLVQFVTAPALEAVSDEQAASTPQPERERYDFDSLCSQYDLSRLTWSAR
jgi:hypothetical protein